MASAIPSLQRKRAAFGVVLGAGAARGWSHIGALRALSELGVPIDVICGCSSGALVAASYAAGRLDILEELARGMTRANMLRFMDVSLAGGGMIEGRWIVDFVRNNIGDTSIEAAPLPFGTVASEFGSGREVWFTSGSMIDAVRASIALPGILTPVHLRGRWLVDGALVNPLPVTLCRSLGADVIIAINTGGDLAPGRPSVLETSTTTARKTESSWLSRLIESQPQAAARAHSPSSAVDPNRPGYFEVLGNALLTMENFIGRVRLAADPPDIVITPENAHIGVMEFHRGAEAIACGFDAVQRRAEEIKQLLAP